MIEFDDDFIYLLPRYQGDVSAMETIPPSTTPDVLLDRPSRWITSSCTIELKHLRTALRRFGCYMPTVDAFTATANH